MFGSLIPGSGNDPPMAVLQLLANVSQYLTDSERRKHNSCLIQTGHTPSIWPLSLGIALATDLGKSRPLCRTERTLWVFQGSAACASAGVERWRNRNAHYWQGELDIGLLVWWHSCVSQKV